MLSKTSISQQTDLLLLRCARRFCIRLRSMASGSVRGPALVLDEAFTIMYILYGNNLDVICRGVRPE